MKNNYGKNNPILNRARQGSMDSQEQSTLKSNKFIGANYYGNMYVIPTKGGRQAKKNLMLTNNRSIMDKGYFSNQ